MRVFKYWKKETQSLNILGTLQPSSSYGGSNLSLEDASNEAFRKLKKAQDIINGIAQKDGSYETDIIEEIIDEIDSNNIVTRNRYGALVLNSDNLMFIDVDDYPKTYNILGIIFGKKKTKKENILAGIEKTITKFGHENLGFRIYETFKGYRIIVTGKKFNAQSKESADLMNAFYADRLYQMLCKKQNCYRARLTPKPYRMKFKAHKVIFPNRTDIQEGEHKSWVERYNEESNKYSSCHFIKSYGMHTTNQIIEYHDRMTNTRQKKLLA